MRKIAGPMGCLLVGIIATSIAVICGLDPETSGMIGFGTTAISLLAIANFRRPR